RDGGKRKSVADFWKSDPQGCHHHRWHQIGARHDAECQTLHRAATPGMGFDRESLFEWNHDAVTRLAADHPSHVTVAGSIVRQHDVAGAEASHRAVAGLDFNLSGERNHILASWRWVIIAPMGRRHPTKEHSVHRLNL